MKKKQWMGWSLVVSGALIMLACGMIGFLQSYPLHYGDHSLPDVLLSLFYSAIQLFFIETFIGPDDRIRPLLNIARFGAPLLLAITAIKTFAVLLEKEIHEWKLGHLRGHVVICGLGRKGYEVARQIMPKSKVVIIELAQNNDYFTVCRDAGAYMITGNCADGTLLEKARVEFAKEVYLLTGTDGVNFSTLVRMSEFKPDVDGKKLRPKVWLHLNAIEMCSFLRDEKTLRSIRERVDFEIVSIFEIAARELVVDELIPLLPVLPDDTRRLHLFQVGFGRMGQSIVQKLVQCAVTENKARTRISVLSSDAERDLKQMEAEMPGIHTCCDLAAQTGDILSCASRKALIIDVEKARRDGEIPVISMAVNSQYTNLTAALFLAEELVSNKLGDVPLFVRQTESEGWTALADDLSRQGDGKYKMIKGFGALTNLCQLDVFQQERLDRMARALHEAYLAAQPVLKPEEASHKQWPELAWLFRQSNRNAADHLRVKLRTVGLDWKLEKIDPNGPGVPFNLSDENLSRLARLEHCRWEVEKMLTCWTQGDKTDYDDKIHPCLVKWDKLPHEEQRKDFDQIRACAKALQAGGYTIIQEASAGA